MGAGGREVLLGILVGEGVGGGVPPGSPNPDPIFQTKKNYFSHPFSEQVSKKLCHKRGNIAFTANVRLA